MRIVNLQAENVKRVVAVDITPDGDLVVLAGANAQGKTSVLDAIWFALDGAAAKKATTMPIREGQSKASVRLDLGDLIVTRVWSNNDRSRLTVTDAAGVARNSPQQLLDDLVGRLSFDPLAFAQAKPKDQREMLVTACGIGEQIAQIEAERASAYERRTDHNREVKRLEGALTQIPAPPPGTPNELVDTAALMAEEGQLTRALDAYDAARADYEHALAELEVARQRGSAAYEAVLATGQAGPEAAVNRRTLLQHQLANSTATNTAVQAKHQRAQMSARLASERSSSEAMTDAIERADQAKAAAVHAARLPVDGLGVSDDGVTLNGKPFSQASGAEQLKASVAIAMAANPQVRVIRIADGSLLDSASMAMLEQMARQHDFQIWIERVDESGQVGVVIEDGVVKS